ncbi:MAG: hypothetical protein WD552_01690 [Candidatus Paceibacterota bacterium]
MNNLYHFVPQNMQGTVLYPLNELKDVYPDIYEEAKSKYKGREAVMQQHIPFLDCLWNDVLHLTAVHPKDIKEALGAERKFKAFVINPHSLAAEKTVVYLYQHKDRMLKMDKENFSQYDPDDIGQYAELPEATKEYYREMREKGERPLLFVRVPHILYKGSVDTSNLEIVEV